MAEAASVVVVGAGATGASIAYHLALLGCRDVVVLDRAHPAAGASGRGAGGVRRQFSHPLNIRLSQLGLDALARFREEIGVDPGFHPIGYLLLAGSEAEWAALRQQAELQRSLGVETRLLSPAEAAGLAPGLEPQGLVGASHTPGDGYADPVAVCRGYLARAQGLGVRVRHATAVLGVRLAGERVEAVETSWGTIATPTLVVAAGAWSAEVARLAGVDLPIQPYPRSAFVAEPSPGWFPTPFVIEYGTAFWWRPHRRGVLFGMTDRAAPNSFDTRLDWGWLRTVRAQAARRYPALASAPVADGWAGLYDVTPDGNPVLGPVLERPGLVVAAGFSGHGFMHCFAVGRLMAELILRGRAETLEVDAFSLARFRQGPAVAEHTLI